MGEATNVEDNVYHEDNNQTRDVTGHVDTAVGTTVFMSGVTSGKQEGEVLERYIQKNSATFGTLYRQFKADYSSSDGDSGAPVYKISPGGVSIVGVHWGDDGTYRYFSPISGVTSDLGVEPLD